MALVYLLSLAEEDSRDGSWSRSAYRILKESAALGQSRHRLTDNPYDADIILFAELTAAEPYCERILRHPLVQQLREKCFLFNAGDRPIAFLPGVYASIEKRWYFPSRVRTGFYLSDSTNPYLDFSSHAGNQHYLYSFMGSIDNHPVRRAIANLDASGSYCEDTSGTVEQTFRSGDKAALDSFYKRYAEVLEASDFVLCPRGVGVGSVRLFEAMRAARVPVIISDDWVEPEGPEWSTFSVRIRESAVQTIPDCLKSLRPEVGSMGKKARAAWEKYFSPQASFHTTVEACLSILRSRKIPERWSYPLMYLQLFRPHHWRHYLRTRF
ncbi:MAG TPA: hypothetical protein DIU37_02915 [Opitutae bacterium]|nr:hypothetical protein [Opitutae bacterium]|tara:strand:+ start:2012 stop:2986 length:975 start_codon:yes stop_codon:yes gene_type:complete